MSDSSPPDHKSMAPLDCPEEATASVSGDENCCQAIMKGKRTKRKRVQQVQSPSPSPSPASSSAELSCTTTTEEEEDMANCLILLAQGRALESSTTVTHAAAVNGSHLYECKTCNKCFPSFQALGGHRASHKKPKVAGLVEDAAFAGSTVASVPNPAAAASAVDPGGANMAGGGGAIKSGGGGKGRVHECSICGSEFSSGQALGGHMRRHRPLAAVSEQAHEEGETKKKKERSLLSLDLNLPAPSEDDRAVLPPTFVLGKTQPLLFSAWVDCHY